MKLPLSWLKEYITINQPPSQIAKILTMAGLEVDAIETISPDFNHVVIGRITHVEKHPNADNLRIAIVIDGINEFQVVCGAPNCRVGLKTAFAMVGATLRDENQQPFTIKATKIRGIASYGMLCSGKELQISDEESGIIEFADHMKEGADVAEIYADTIFEISLTPNLGHCASVIGVARELSAATGQPLRMPSIEVQETVKEPIENFLRISVHDDLRCPRYACRFIHSVVIGPSPEWLQRRLTACGLRPINNVVDITNYVSLELGQPLHAFDYDLLEGHEINLRCAKKDEPFITLDNKERILHEDDLLICDGSKPIAIAGVMGGLNSEVSENSVRIAIESAYFNPSSIRKTSKRLGLQTDASKRFERGSDPNQVLIALNRAVMLIEQFATGQTVTGTIDLAKSAFPEKTIKCRLHRINQILGLSLGVGEVEAIFKRLQFSSSWDDVNTFTVTSPTYRVDINEEIDLIEEVARIYGYDHIPKPMARYHSSTLPHAPLFLFEKEVRNRLIAEGLQEFLTCSLIGPTLSEIVNDSQENTDDLISVINPTSIEQSILRTSLLPGLLQLVKYNVDHQNHHIAGFEIGRIYFKQNEHHQEQGVTGIILSGKEAPSHWENKPNETNFFTLKGILENVLTGLRIENLSFKNNTRSFFHPGRQALIYTDSTQLGMIGEVHPAILKKLDINQRIFFAELNLQEVYQARKPLQKMKNLPLYPSSERDWTVTLKEETTIDELFALIRKASSELLEEVSLLDIYRSEKLGREYKNVTFHFVYRDTRRTIIQSSVDTEHENIIKEVVKSNLIINCGLN